MNFKWLVLFVFFVTLFKFFYIIPWGYVEGAFNSRDISILILFLGLFYYAIFTNNSVFAGGGGGVDAFLYIVLVLLHVSLASLNYSQSIYDGLIAGRVQFLYLSYLFLLWAIKDIDEIHKALNLLLYIGLIVFLLTLINYFVVPIFYHHKAEGWGVFRSGIKRAFVPATPLLSLAAVWSLSKWIMKGRKHVIRDFSGIMSLLLIGAHFFQQSRGSIISLLAAMFVLFFITKSYQKLMLMAGVGIVAVMIMGVVMEENILLTPFSSTVQDVSEKSGSVGDRMVQLETDLEEFAKHPIIGSGLIAIRSSTYGKSAYERGEMAAKARTADLGYSHWIKMYGLVGVGWLLTMYIMVAESIRKILPSDEYKRRTVELFCIGYAVFIAISGVTLNHFLIDERIVLFCLMLAIIQRLRLTNSNVKNFSKV